MVDDDKVLIKTKNVVLQACHPHTQVAACLQRDFFVEQLLELEHKTGKELSWNKGNVSSAILPPKKSLTSKYFMIAISKTGIYLCIPFIYLQACSKNSHSFKCMHKETDSKFTDQIWGMYL